MSHNDIFIFDWHRIFFGQLPWQFTFEVLFRTVFMYLFSLALMQTISRRMEGQLSLIEFLLVIALGSAVGDPLFYPEVPLIHAMIVVTVVVSLNRAIIFLINRNEMIETGIEGIPLILVNNGVIDLNSLDKARLSQERLFEILRLGGIRQLGQIEYAYHEQSGEISVFQRDQVQAGLPIVPPWDIDEPKVIDSKEMQSSDLKICCKTCGALHHKISSECFCGGKPNSFVEARLS